MKKIKKGLFIVLDGTDGSGKATQTRLLIKRLKKEGYGVEKIDFPQYGKKSAALVEEYLNGMYGAAEEVGPYRASVFYACDRYAARDKIKKWLNEEKIVVCDRYVTANMGHQGGKIKNISERNKYFKWLDDLEYNIFRIPKPDANIILHVDASVAQKMINPNKKRGYIEKGERDIHENDLKHLQNAEKVYLEIAKKFPEFYLIECMRNGSIIGKEEVSGLIWGKLKRRLVAISKA